MLKVLVVEDEEMIRKGIVLAVDWAALDCVVVGEASNGEEALAAVERYAPSLIITDLKMPKMDGIEMLRHLRERGNRAYVIILTAYDSFSYAQSALRLGKGNAQAVRQLLPGLIVQRIGVHQDPVQIKQNSPNHNGHSFPAQMLVS